MNRSKTAPHQVVNLDDQTFSPWSLIVSFEGVRTLIDSERLARLLTLEQDQLSGLAAGTAFNSPDGAQTTQAPLRVRQIPVEPVSHGSLSSRITKIYNYSLKHQTLRPAHAGILGEFLQAFDGILPEHAGNKIPTLLAEIAEWQSVPADLKFQIQDFLRRYRDVAATRSA